ncbi:MAG TPA: TIGR03560 family F420-dependent LLM class oxidoreductase [Actinomycetota bacterium]|jgi:F420-dependent oxidoreductase-like protein|nr:TIGR03560 family F420-dependent LLM class oxidoreductase [Actinomycetota bacterium]
MRFCLMLEGQEGVTWPDWLAAGKAAERLGFDGIFSSDHYLSVIRHRDHDRGSSDAWTMLSALAASTTSIRLGTLVSPVTFRLPAHLAKTAVTVDRVSGGRVEIGMGAGWWEEEHRTHGFPFPDPSTRFDMLAEQLEIVHGLLTEERFSFRGQHYQLDAVPFAPKGTQEPHPPIIVGGNGGPRVAELVSRWADEFNTVGPSPEQARERIGRVRDRLDADGRGQETLTTSVMTWCYVGETERDAMRVIEQARTRAMRVARFEDELDELRAHCVVGSVDQAVERLNEYVAAGVQRIMLNHEVFDDLEMLDVLAERVFPQVTHA